MVETCEDLLRMYRDVSAKLKAATKKMVDVVAGRERDLFQSVWEEVRLLQSECTRLRKDIRLHLENHSYRL